jgi:hypothetical protein
MNKTINKRKFKVVNPIIDAMDSIIDNINAQMKHYFESESTSLQKQNNRFDAPPISTIKFNLPPQEDFRNVSPSQIQTN